MELSKSRGTIFAALSLLIANASAVAGTPHLIKDINAANVAIGSYPHELTDFGNLVYFTAGDGRNSAQPWTTDGTPEGTFVWGGPEQGLPPVTGRIPVRAGNNL